MNTDDKQEHSAEHKTDEQIVGVRYVEGLPDWELLPPANVIRRRRNR